MRPKNLLLGPAAFGAAVVIASACLQNGSIKIAQQLPTNIFTNLPRPPLVMEMSLPGGPQTMSLGMPSNNPRQSVRDQAEAIIRHFEAEAGGLHSSGERNDYAVALVLVGRYSDAIDVLKKIEQDFPGKYDTASNLGTAYELKGDVRSALEWIRKGITRNPESHAGTEWLHVAILETKLKLLSDPLWLGKHSVMEGHEARSRTEKEKALEYQLNERLNFIHGNDPIMHDLFLQAAQLTEDPAKREYYLGQLPRFAPRAKSVTRSGQP